MKILKPVLDLFEEHRGLIYKTAFGVFVIFLLLQAPYYMARHSASFIRQHIQNGLIDELCVAHSSDIYEDVGGIHARVDNQKFYIAEKWGTLEPEKDLYLAILLRPGRENQAVLIDSGNARRFLQSDHPVGCRYF